MDHLNAGQRGMAAAMVYPEAKHGGDASASTVDLPIPRRGCHNHRSPCRWCGSSPAKAGHPDRSSGVDNGPPEACSGGLFDGHGSKNVCARSLSRKRLKSVVGQKRVGASTSFPLYPTKQTSTVATATSVSCQEATLHRSFDNPISA